MNINSPVPGWKNNEPVYRSQQNEFKSPYKSPQNNSPAFSPFSPGSPKKQFRSQMRYFNNSNSTSSSCGSNGTPFRSHYKNNKDRFNKNRSSSTDSTNISLYYDPSALENPWAELEKEYEEKKKMESQKEITAN